MIKASVQFSSLFVSYGIYLTLLWSLKYKDNSAQAGREDANYQTPSKCLFLVVQCSVETGYVERQHHQPECTWSLFGHFQSTESTFRWCVL